MAARDRYPLDVKCSNCGQTGTLRISEDDHPYMTNLHRAVDSVEGDFDASVHDGLDVQVVCLQCHHTFSAFK